MRLSSSTTGEGRPGEGYEVSPETHAGGGSFLQEDFICFICMIVSENMASSFQGFLAETFASYSPDDSHLALKTIFSCFSFSTCSWRVPAISAVSISLPLASLGRSSMRPAIESRACTLLLLLCPPCSKAHQSTSEVNSSSLYHHEDR